jgi:hypothetical protein
MAGDVFLGLMPRYAASSRGAQNWRDRSAAIDIFRYQGSQFERMTGSPIGPSIGNA